MRYQTPIRFADRQYWVDMRTSTGTVGGRLAAAALTALLLSACGRPAPAEEVQSSTAPDPAAESTTPSSATVDAAVPTGDSMAEDTTDGSAGTDPEPTEAASPAITAPALTADQVVGVVDPTPGMAGVKITSQNPIVAPTPTAAPPDVADTTPTGAAGVHVVQPGDTLSAIAGTYGVSMQAIIDANGLVDPDNLTAGDELQIPPSG